MTATCVSKELRAKRVSPMPGLRPCGHGPGRADDPTGDADDADEVARLLHDFNREFNTPSPGVEVLGSACAGCWPRT